MLKKFFRDNFFIFQYFLVKFYFSSKLKQTAVPEHHFLLIGQKTKQVRRGGVKSYLYR